MTRILTLLLLLGAASLRSLSAAEIQLRESAQPRGAVVLLGDVAQVASNDQAETARLEALELFAVPVAGGKRFVRLREIQDALALRGEPLAAHAFSGANQVAVEAGRPDVSRKEPLELKSSSTAETKRAQRRARDSLLRYLREQNGHIAGWNVSFELSDEQVRWLTHSRGEVSVGGGAKPWSGKQDFELQGESPEGPFAFALVAEITNPPLIVVAVRALGRGVRIGTADVQLAPPGGEVPTNACANLEDVVGQETVQALATGQPISPELIRAPLLIRRGEAVTVYARSPGLRVRTTARAREDGSEGELVTVESLAGDRQTFFARVCGLQEVEIYARAVSTDESPKAETVQDHGARLDGLNTRPARKASTYNRVERKSR